MEIYPPLSGIGGGASLAPFAPAGLDDDLFDFDKLKLVDKPENSMNSLDLPQSLKECEGYLTKLPLKPPNVDQKNPTTVVDMVNIMTNPCAAALFDKRGDTLEKEHTFANDASRSEGVPSGLYDYSTSELMKDQLSLARRKTSHIAAPLMFGHVVLPGCISFYKKDGRTYAVGEGRWLLPNPKASWCCRNVSLDQDVIAPSKTQVLIIRILKGEVGLVMEQGVEKLLDVGSHVYNSGTVSLVGKKQYANDQYFSHGRYHYLRVPRGKLAKVWAEVVKDGVRSLVPRLLGQGEHYIDSNMFKYEYGLVDESDPYIHHGSVHIIRVAKGSVAKAMHNTKPRLLGMGDHIVESTQFEFIGTESIISNLCIVHETITILRVPLGKIALAWKDNEPVFIDEPGLYEFDSPDFEFVEYKNADERLIQLGAKKIVLVHTGSVGVTYDGGILKILPNGRHIINSSNHIFHSFLSTQEKSLRLVTLSENEKFARKSTIGRGSGAPIGLSSTAIEECDLTVCETRDLVKVGLRADVFYSIEDPEKCLNKIDSEELEDLVRETAVSTLTNIVRSTTLNEIAQSKHVTAGSPDVSTVPVFEEIGDRGGNPPPSAPMRMFFDKAHDDFLSKLHDDFMSRYGVSVSNIRIESFKIMDEELSESISKHALTTAQIENEMANLEGKSLISTTEERTAAEVKNIAAEADALALKTEADASNQRKIDGAKADAEALKIAAAAKADAEAEAILAKAKAEAEAIRLRAAAEAQRAEMLSQTQLGEQESLLGLYANMVVSSNQGVEKVVYLDPSVNKESPFALGSLENLNRDLHALTQIGVAAGEGSKAPHQ
uniref:Band 7 domain-containing protein n=1 Tax=Odontella aurita TaxID=265563 RepID=A0A7S4IHY0_9STRA|mmetsp:Transcript_25290/g.74385  ORF Transcript_25290/g.74385 Transcript_25290/m.74385 type:complete len:831 (+) Transcript_25290:135-2627(+)